MNNSKCYFGAANGYSGFRSNFNKIFSYAKVDKLFIIKGGPGTGKSTLMRKIQTSCGEASDVISILCSSDPNSLDGLLISKEGVSIGVVDGTPPHTIEPKYPGAYEELINLGDAFDYSVLRRKKHQIKSLSDQKSLQYLHAYASLKIAGEIHSYITDIFLKNSNYATAEQLCKELIDEENSALNTSNESDFLIGAFCKNGYKRIDNFNSDKKKIRIIGDGISEYILLTALRKNLDKSGVGFTIFPSAFSSEIPDAIETKTAVYSISDSAECDIDSRVLMPKTCEYERLKASYKCFIENAQIALIKASEFHFKLEEIYSGATLFEENENKYLKILKEIEMI